jgi:Flp pilus assembly protein TadG
MLNKLFKDLRQSTSGAAILEAAVVLPVLIIMMGGIFDFGRAYSTLVTAQKSLRGAVRYLTLLPSGAVCDWGATNAKNLAVYGNTAGTGTALLTGWTVSNISLDSPATCSYSASVGKITMSASVPYTSIMWSVVGLPASITMNVQYEERWIGQ